MHNSVDILKSIKLYTLNGWHFNHNSIKLFLKVKNKGDTSAIFTLLEYIFIYDTLYFNSHLFIVLQVIHFECLISALISMSL